MVTKHVTSFLLVTCRVGYTRCFTHALRLISQTGKKGLPVSSAICDR